MTKASFVTIENNQKSVDVNLDDLPGNAIDASVDAINDIYDYDTSFEDLARATVKAFLLECLKTQIKPRPLSEILPSIKSINTPD
jgi:hypothetical protein